MQQHLVDEGPHARVADIACQAQPRGEPERLLHGRLNRQCALPQGPGAACKTRDRKREVELSMQHQGVAGRCHERCCRQGL